jgi:hypothetical protein
MVNVAPVVAERIRRPVPSGLSVLPGSLPVVSFGDPDVAVVATLSLNPSWREFQSQRGEWLLGDRCRLASLVSLGVEDPRDLTDAQVAQVVAESHGYFGGPNWYRAWFRWLESLLQGSRAGSYLDGSACHLDLVQWATKPAQGDLSPMVWGRLVEHGRDFLRWQLRNSNVELVLLNGASVVREVQRAGLVAGFDEDVLAYQTAKGEGRIRVFRAIAEGLVFLGWNRPLAGALSSDGRQRLEHWVAQAVQEGASALPGGSAAVRTARRTGGAMDLVNGFVPAGTEVDGARELERVLSLWIEASNAPTVGDVGSYGGSPVIIGRMGSDEFVLNRDTKRAAVRTFLVAAGRAGGAEHLRWHVTANARGVINRVSYRPDDEPTPGWYAYLRETSSEPREL